MANKIALGTVQFGLDYGINNSQGKTPYTEVEAILSKASQQGIGLLDTAAAYGDSEAVLGRYLQQDPAAFRLVTKLPATVTMENADQHFNTSLERLGVNSVYGLIFHNFESYQKQPGLWDYLLQQKQAGRVEKIGCSLYHPQELEALVNAGHIPDLIQFPFNILDRRFEALFPLLEEHNVELHTRSSFLQGLFFRAPESLPEFFAEAKPMLGQIQAFAKEHEQPLGALLLGWCLAQPALHKVVIGVDTVQNLADNLAALRIPTDTQRGFSTLVNTFSAVAEDILLPYTWPQRS
ncbi:MAG TPA: aldo/keto reductase [Cytophagales bacterium]|nr:aldo/keto reductase [Cytophagales bacterium]HAA18393.1 aldo/keto reductase [Cytophagales bacterium]HAP61441.1 aldo/keto reductase [Cytophagales bacterium]